MIFFRRTCVKKFFTMENLKSFGLSFTGRRQNNEDAFLIHQINKDFRFFAVADGMGGAEGGEIASNEVLRKIKEFLTESDESLTEVTDLKPLLVKLFQFAQEAIHEIINTRTELKGMGSTLTAMLLYKDHYVWGNIGDCRIFRVENNQINQITEDHTYIQEYNKTHEEPLSPGIVKQYGNVITRVIDGGKDLPDIFPDNEDSLKIPENSLFILCSDGLITDKAGDQSKDLLEIVKGTKDLNTAAEQLIAHAFDKNSTDNITVVLIENGQIKRRKKGKRNKYIYPPRENIIKHSDKSVKKLIHRLRFPLILLLTGIIIASLCYSAYLFFWKENQTISKNSPALKSTTKKEKSKNAESINSVNKTDKFEQITFSKNEVLEYKKKNCKAVAGLLCLTLSSKSDSARLWAFRSILSPISTYLSHWMVEISLIDTLLGKEYSINGLETAIKTDLLKIVRSQKTFPFGTGGTIIDSINKTSFIKIDYSKAVKELRLISDTAVFAKEAGFKMSAYLMQSYPDIKEKISTIFKKAERALQMKYIVLYDKKGELLISKGSSPDKDIKAENVQDFYAQFIPSADNTILDISILTTDKQYVLRMGFKIK